ncbi:MAG: hypothetical protein ABII90_04270, partial [Bacteroidota bacterium]
LLKQAEIYEKGREGILLAIIKLGLTMVDISDIQKGQYIGYGELIPSGAGEISPDEAQRIEYEYKAEFSRQMAAYCKEKFNKY